MRMTMQTVAALPHLSWLAEVDLAGASARVLHGDWVETGANFFIEGAWSGAYAQGAFDRCDSVFGSGAVLRGGQLVFVSSSTTTDYLFYRRLGAQLLVSNSLACLLARSGDALDPHDTGHVRNCESISQGIDDYQAAVPTRQGGVQRLMFRNLVVDGATLQLADKPLCAPFADYAGYTGFLRERYGALMDNARDRARRRPLQILSTQSKGYDSTAVNALAAPFGVDRVFTVSHSKGSGAFAEHDAAGQGDDDGSDIARQLGLPCLAIERRSFKEELPDEYLYFAGLTNCEDLNFVGITRHITQPSLLLTGTLGELFYERSRYGDFFPGRSIGTELRRGDLGGGHGLTEVRLQNGFVQVPLLYIGAQQRDSIASITAAAEMQPWRLGTSYDRPVPRRMAEEAGVARASFGQKKMASVVSYARPNLPQGAALRAAFLGFLREQRLLAPWQTPLFRWVHRYNALAWFATPVRHRWFYLLSRVSARLAGRPLGLLWTRLDGALYCYCVSRRKQDYAEALAPAGMPAEREPAAAAAAQQPAAAPSTST